jgi:hypothetical protein
LGIASYGLYKELIVFILYFLYRKIAPELREKPYFRGFFTAGSIAGISGEPARTGCFLQRIVRQRRPFKRFIANPGYGGTGDFPLSLAGGT